MIAHRALRRDGRCFNCADATHQPGECSVCATVAPVEHHHVAGKRHAPDTIAVCLNCHGILSHWQRHWPADRQRGTRPELFVMQGWFDVLRLAEQRGGPAPADLTGRQLWLSLVVVLAVPSLTILGDCINLAWINHKFRKAGLFQETDPQRNKMIIRVQILPFRVRFLVVPDHPSEGAIRHVLEFLRVATRAVIILVTGSPEV